MKEKFKENLREGEKQYSIAIVIRNFLLFAVIQSFMELLFKLLYADNGSALIEDFFFKTIIVILVILLITFFKRKRYISPIKNFLMTVFVCLVINLVGVLSAYLAFFVL